MRSTVRILIWILAALMLAACQASPAPVDPAAPSPVTATEAVPAVDPALDPAYPAAVESAPQGVGVYPGLMDGDILTWPQLQTLLQSGEVAKVVQQHDLTALITLVDGRTLTVTQPQLDAVMELIQACGDPCKNVAVATE